MAVAQVGALGLGADLVGKLQSGESNERGVQQLAVRYWGAVLFELGANLRAVAEHHEGRVILRFVVFDALIDDLCRLDPSPAALHRLNDAITWLRRRDEAPSQPKTICKYVPAGTSSSPDDLADLDAVYEWLCDELRTAGERAHGHAWEQLEPHIVPPERRSLSTLSSRERIRRQRAAAESREHDAAPGPEHRRRRGRYHYSEFED